ncbi:MAG: phosphotransferase family protein [Flavobacteriaceae bacterium]
MSGRIDRQDAFSGTKEVPQALAFDAGRLERYLEGRIEGFRGPLQVSQFKGGQSNPTYLLTTPERAYVLRRKPPGRLLPSAHAVDREFRVISALHEAAFPVARPWLLCDDEDVIGTMFYVMDRVEGRIFWEPAIPGVERAERAAIYDAMNETIARLHSFDPAALGLADFGKGEGYVARQIRRWSGQYEASRTEDIAAMDRLMEWLPGAAPQTSRISLVHGDYRLDNLIVEAGAPRVKAVLDWELATLGDPLGDFTYHLMTWFMPVARDGGGTGSLKETDLPGLGIPSAEDYVARYCERTGTPGIADLDFYLAYNFFRLAAILQGIVGRVRDGTATNQNAAAMASQVRPLAETAWRFAGKAGAGSTGPKG